MISLTVDSVPSCVEPPAPKVTENKCGLSAPSCLRTSRSLAAPSGVFGGNSSKLNLRSDSFFMGSPTRTPVVGQQPAFGFCGCSVCFPGPLSVAIGVRFVRTLLRHADIGGLLAAQFGQLRIQLGQLQARDFLVQVLGQVMEADREFCLVGE